MEKVCMARSLSGAGGLGGEAIVDEGEIGGGFPVEGGGVVGGVGPEDFAHRGGGGGGGSGSDGGGGAPLFARGEGGEGVRDGEVVDLKEELDALKEVGDGVGPEDFAH